jgi:hypothetical protein
LTIYPENKVDSFARAIRDALIDWYFYDSAGAGRMHAWRSVQGSGGFAAAFCTFLLGFLKPSALLTHNNERTMLFLLCKKYGTLMLRHPRCLD